MRHALFASIVLGACASAADAQETIARETMSGIKNATVFLKTKAGAYTQSGTGFVVRVDGESAIIATNEHVVTVPKTSWTQGTRPQVTAVFGSGTTDERSATAEVLAADPARDLAILGVAGIPKLPRPIDVGQESEMIETMTVYTFGFPYGEALSTTKGSPAITVGRGSVSSLRLDDRGRVRVVQIDGALNPGNSGGPVVDVKGRLVGVAVATIRGANNLGLAIPPYQLTETLKGRLGNLAVKSRVADDKAFEITVTAPLIDPLSRLRSVALDYAPAGSRVERPQPKADGTWGPITGTTRIELEIQSRVASGTFRTGDLEKGVDTLWIQMSFRDSEGTTQYTEPFTFTFALKPTVRPAVAARPPQAGVSPPREGFAQPPGSRGSPASRPVPTGESVAGGVSTVADLVMTEILVAAGEVPGCLFWDPDGKSFFVMEKTGTVRRVRLEGFREELRWQTGQPCTWLSQSSRGLLLTVAGLRETWLIDPITFDVKTSLALPSADGIVSAPSLAIAFTTGDRGQSLSIVELEQTKVVQQYSPRDFGLLGGGFKGPAVAPDGKYLFLQGGVEQLLRFRIQGTELIYEEASERIAQNGQRVEVSPDGAYVAIPSAGGNYGPRPYQTNIYEVNNLTRPKIVIESGAYPRALGFDVKAGFIYAQNQDHPLIIFLASGLKRGEYLLPSPGFGVPPRPGNRPPRAGARQTTRQFAVHPDGGKFLLLTDRALYFVQQQAQAEKD